MVDCREFFPGSWKRSVVSQAVIQRWISISVDKIISGKPTTICSNLHRLNRQVEMQREWKQNNHSVACKIICSELNLLFLYSSKTWGCIWIFLKIHAWMYSQKGKSNFFYYFIENNENSVKIHYVLPLFVLYFLISYLLPSHFFLQYFTNQKHKIVLVWSIPEYIRLLVLK